MEEIPPEDIPQVAPSLRYHAHDGESRGIILHSSVFILLTNPTASTADAIGSVAFHPTDPVLLSVSGSRHFQELPSPPDSSEGSADEDGESANLKDDRPSANVVVRKRRRPYPVTLDSSVKIWNFNSVR